MLFREKTTGYSSLYAVMFNLERAGFYWSKQMRRDVRQNIKKGYLNVPLHNEVIVLATTEKQTNTVENLCLACLGERKEVI